MSNHSLCTNHAPWINGAQGAMFWDLSDSDDIAYAIARQISKEAYLASAYLLEPDAGLAATIDSSAGSHTAQFILKKHPDYGPPSYNDLMMLMVCNNASITATINISIPGDQIVGMGPIVYGYNWSYSLNNNLISLEMEPYTARAFILYVPSE